MGAINIEEVISLAPEQPRLPTVIIKPTKGWAALNLRELWRYRDLLSILIERDIKLRYKQTALGIVWVVLQPLIAALIFAAIFGRLAKLPSDGMPYLLFVFCGLTAWNYFSQALQRAGNSLVSNAQLVSKIYFPRLLIPLAHTLAVLVDFVVMLLVLFVMMAIYHVAPSIRILALPVFLLLATLTATGVALWFSALGVKYRDFMYALPFLVQVWMYASPVVYPMSLIPARWQLWFALNPATGFIEGFRWSVLGTGAFDQRLLLITIAVSILSFLSGTFFFRRVERSFADVI
jgi:lipopolysaccharide transport system permease protein